MDTQSLLERARVLADAPDRDRSLADTDVIVFLLENCDITFSDDAFFFGRVNTRGVVQPLLWERIRTLGVEFHTEENRRGTAVRAYTGSHDFGHTAPLWDDIMRLGLPGMLERVRIPSENPVNPSFFPCEVRVWEAALAFAARAADAARQCGKTEIAEGLWELTRHAPQTLYQAMQLILVFYNLQHEIEGTNVRTLGRLDRLFAPFAESDSRAPELLKAFIREIDSYHADANIPFMLGGSDADGNDLFCRTSTMILDAYAAVQPANVKFHVLCTGKMPADFLRHALDCVRKGSNSMVFMNDAVVIRSLEKLGESHADAVDYSVVGCYECGGREETACTCNARVNIPKALELTLHGGRDGLTGEQITPDFGMDFRDFDELYSAFLSELRYLTRQAMDITDRYEAEYPRCHASPFFSATYPDCIRKGGDVFLDSGAKYANSSINALGLATAVDSLAAIRKLVYDDKRLTLSEFVKILDDNWEGQELLRRTVLNRFPRYGNGDPDTDALAVRIVRDLGETVNGVPNAKGGVYRLGTFSIDWRIDFGAHTAASADGRLSGEPISQNTGASFGADREGAAPHLVSVSSIDFTDTANGSIVDLDLPASLVRGETGLSAMQTLLDGFFARGGFAVHINVLDTAALRDAQAHPEAYPNLQVRLCGWNVRFTELSPSAQAEFIRRSENQEG